MPCHQQDCRIAAADLPYSADAAEIQQGERWSLTIRALPEEAPEWVRSPERPWFSVLTWSDGQQPFRFEGEFEA